MDFCTTNASHCLREEMVQLGILLSSWGLFYIFIMLSKGPHSSFLSVIWYLLIENTLTGNISKNLLLQVTLWEAFHGYYLSITWVPPHPDIFVIITNHSYYHHPVKTAEGCTHGITWNAVPILSYLIPQKQTNLQTQLLPLYKTNPLNSEHAC